MIICQIALPLLIKGLSCWGEVAAPVRLKPYWSADTTLLAQLTSIMSHNHTHVWQGARHQWEWQLWWVEVVTYGFCDAAWLLSGHVGRTVAKVSQK